MRNSELNNNMYSQTVTSNYAYNLTETNERNDLSRNKIPMFNNMAGSTAIKRNSTKVTTK